MILNAEEIEKIIGRSDHLRLDSYAEVAKEVVRKIVGLIKEKQAYTAIVSESGNEVPFFNPIDWEEIWQALLEEIK